MKSTLVCIALSAFLAGYSGPVEGMIHNANATVDRQLASAYSWEVDTSSARTISGVRKDPVDPSATSHGSGSITIATNGIVTMEGSPRYYVTAPAGTEFGNVEIEAYGRLRASKSSFKSYAGMTVVTRSNHGRFEQDPCQALGYYSRIYFQTGEFAFQKEFAHDMSTRTTWYSASRRHKLFEGGFPVNQWIGMRFQVRTSTDGKSVNLKGFIDRTNRKNNGTWELVFETNDLGDWPALEPLPSQCRYPQNKVVLRAGQNSFFRTDDVEEFQWKHMEIRPLV